MSRSICKLCSAPVNIVLTNTSLVAACACTAVTADGQIIHPPEGQHFGIIVRKKELLPGEQYISLTSPPKHTTIDCDVVDAELADEEAEVTAAVEPRTLGDKVFHATIIILVLLISGASMYYMFTH